MNAVRRPTIAGLVIAACCTGCAALPATPPPAPAAAAAANPAAAGLAPPAATAPQTLPQFLGLTGLCQAGGNLLTRIRSRLGMRWPGLEGGTPMLPITDPANLDSPNPAVAAAADIKAQEDAAPQKIKALRYLASIGCGGCYPDVEDALLAGLDDCTESVRYEAVSALRRTAGDPCQFCRDDKCCSPAVLSKLREVAYGTREGSGCFQEPSARVRRMARLALAGCGGPFVEPALPEEGPREADLQDVSLTWETPLRR